MRREIRTNQNLQNWPEERWTLLRQLYYAMCTRVDWLFGEVINTLKEKSFYDETAVFFFSDHGDFTGDYGLVEKTQNTFEDCLTRVPLVIKPPRNVPQSPHISNALVELVDFPATVYELCGIDPGYSHFGKSLCKILSGESDTHRDAVFCEGGRLADECHCTETPVGGTPDPDSLYWPKQQAQFQPGNAHTKAAMCRTARYKYVKRLRESDQFYDLAIDPDETHNRIHDETYRHTIMELRMRLLDWYMETGDVVPKTPDERRMTLHPERKA